MSFIIIKEIDDKLLKDFIENVKNYKSFRYFNNRDISCIENHVLTVLLKNTDNNIVGYGHIDYENNIYWIGICVLDKYQNNGYGDMILSYLLEYSFINTINEVKLTVDINNYKAINLYFKHGFKINNYEKNYYQMVNNLSMNNIILPVSPGEAIDKLTILDIKKNKIQDERKKDVINEYNVLSKKLKNIVNNNKYYYSILKKINTDIWEMQDNFRYNLCDKTKLCFDIIELNDRRFRIKKKINDCINSHLKEQKGYKSKKVFLLQHLGMGDHLTCCGMTRYLSTLYDEVLLVCKNKNLNNLKELYSNDKNIIFYVVDNDNEISPRYGFDINKFNEITKDYDKYLCGYHNINKNVSFHNLPFCFYEQLNIDTDILWEYFNVPDISNSNYLFNQVKNYKLIFIHNSSSNGVLFDELTIIKSMNIDIDNYLIINPCNNFYNNDDEIKYNLCESIKNQSIISYKKIIENSDFIFLSDSSFFCLSMNLDLKTNNNYLIKRKSNSYSNYDIIWSDKYNYKKFNKKKFIQLTI